MSSKKSNVSEMRPIAQTSKVVCKFKNQAEKMGFIAGFNELKQAKQNFEQIERIFNQMLEEFDIQDFNFDATYNISEANELVEQAVV